MSTPQPRSGAILAIFASLDLGTRPDDAASTVADAARRARDAVTNVLGGKKTGE